MSIDDKDINAIEDIQEEQTEELVENDEIVLDEDSLEEGSYGKKKMNAMKKHENEDDVEEDEEEEVKEETPSVSIPKTKAGVIQAAVEMLKKARKEDAQKLYAKMAKVDETSEDDSVKSVDDASKKVKQAKAPGGQGPDTKHGEVVKAKVEAVDFDEDLDNLVKEEATLSDEFRGKAGAIFEAVLTSKLSQEVERLEAEYAQNLEEEVTDLQNSLVEKVDSYLNYVVENWMTENEVAINNGLRTEIAEEFMASLQKVFVEHYVDVPESKVDLVDELSEQVTELEAQLNKSTEDNIKLSESVNSLERAEIVREQSSGLAETEAEKLESLVEDIDFDNRDNFEMKVRTVKESYFQKDIVESVDEVESVIGNDQVQVDLSDAMTRYSQAITKFNK
tara:strand:+ start:11476 stop:12651 length:1176 start_codon:yes stop_codon:yes gene_type:complete